MNSSKVEWKWKGIETNEIRIIMDFVKNFVLFI